VHGGIDARIGDQLIFILKPVYIPNLSQNRCAGDRPNPWNAGDVLGDLRHQRFLGGIDLALLLFQQL
jgi:hypothetical protein